MTRGCARDASAKTSLGDSAQDSLIDGVPPDPGVVARAHLAPTLPQLWALVVLAAVFIVLGLGRVGLHDFWWHAGVGRWIVENRQVPDADIFSFTQRGQPFSYSMWLVEVAFYALLTAGGPPLVIFVHTLVITGAYGLLLLVNRQAAGGNLRLASVVTLIAAAVGVTNWNVRPQTVSFLFLCVTYYVLERSSSRMEGGEGGSQATRGLWTLPPAFAVWANSHGGFVFGLALIGSVVAAQLIGWLRRRRNFPTQLVVVAIASAASTLLTPLGTGMVGYVLGLFGHPVVRQAVVEWMPPTVRTLSGQMFFGFLILLLVALVASRYRLKIRESIRLLLFGALALMAVRNVAWFGIVAAPTLAACLSQRGGRRGPVRSGGGRRRANLAVAGLVGVLAMLSLPWIRSYLPVAGASEPLVSGDTPAAAVGFVRGLSQPRRVFHSESYGSYMIWASPEIPVFIDTRVELYPAQQWFDYLSISRARYDWEALLDAYEIDTLLLQRGKQDDLIRAASAARQWDRAYEDERAVVFRLAEGL